MNSLGVYFGPKFIHLAEAKEKKLVNSLQIPNLSFSSQAGDQVPEEVKIVALFKEELRKAKIEAKAVNLVLSGSDLIVRIFEIPALPANELAQAVNFEVKKYIPFKTEELVSDFQVQFDKALNKNLVLFIGIKKESLEKYLSIFRQLEIKIASLEYSAFSIFKLINLSGVSTKGIVAAINVDAEQNDETNFIVAENNFPLLGRDTQLTYITESASGGPEAGIPVEKLNTEIRISLDYYSRKFPEKKIKQVLLVGDKDAGARVEGLIKELGLVYNFVDTSGFTGKTEGVVLGLLKAFSGALTGQVKGAIKINLLSTWAKNYQRKEIVGYEEIAALFSGFKANPKFLIAAGAIICLGAAAGILRQLPLQQEIRAAIASRKLSPKINPSANLAEMSDLETRYQKEFSALNKLIKKQLYLTPELAVMPKILPPGVWLDNLSFLNTDDKEKQFILQGLVYFEDSQRQTEAIEALLSVLKSDENFSRNFPGAQVTSMNTENMQGKNVTKFTISNTGQAKRY